MNLYAISGILRDRTAAQMTACCYTVEAPNPNDAIGQAIKPIIDAGEYDILSIDAVDISLPAKTFCANQAPQITIDQRCMDAKELDALLGKSRGNLELLQLGE